jgi:hypothetical protein
MESILGDITTEAISIIYKECRRKRNRKRLSYIIDNVVSMLMSSIQPYMYAIMAMLIILFLMNCFQFFYYIRMNIIKGAASVASAGLPAVVDSA